MVDIVEYVRMQQLIKRLRRESTNWWGYGILLGFFMGLFAGIYGTRAVLGL